jgi:hypothetical protein
LTASPVRRLEDEFDDGELVAVAALPGGHDRFPVPNGRGVRGRRGGQASKLRRLLGPGTFPRSPGSRLTRNLRAAALLLRLHNRRAAAALLNEVERRHPVEPHWYLGLLATDPGAHG